MEPDKKEQKEQNKYDFIINQGSKEEKTHKPHKKVVVLVVLTIITLLTIVAFTVFSANNNVQQSTDSKYSTEQIAGAKDVVIDFINKADTEDYEAAYNLFSSQPALSKEQFKNEAIPALKKLNLKECTPQSNTDGLVDSAGNIAQTFACPVKDSDIVLDIQFSVVSDPSGQTSIYGYYVVGIEE